MTDIVKRLREKESRYNRDLLDEAADTIERLENLIDTECDSCACVLLEQREKARAEAIKEVFEKVEERLAVHHFTANSTEYADGQLDCMEWVDSKLDELAKEMGVEL